MKKLNQIVLSEAPVFARSSDVSHCNWLHDLVAAGSWISQVLLIFTGFFCDTRFSAYERLFTICNWNNCKIATWKLEATDSFLKWYRRDPSCLSHSMRARLIATMLLSTMVMGHLLKCAEGACLHPNSLIEVFATSFLLIFPTSNRISMLRSLKQRLRLKRRPKDTSKSKESTTGNLLENARTSLEMAEKLAPLIPVPFLSSIFSSAQVIVQLAIVSAYFPSIVSRRHSMQFPNMDWMISRK